MGYFDALTSSYFKTAADGRKLFYPWGVLGRGYVIATDQDQQRLVRQLKIYTIVSFVLIVGAGILQSYMGALVIGLALIVFYVFWARHLVRGLQPSGEGLSMRESYTSQARAHSSGSLWAMEIGSLVLLIGAIAMLIFDPDNRGTALMGIVVFGIITAGITWMLILRRRAIQ
jgi:hypothetical protein